MELAPGWKTHGFEPDAELSRVCKFESYASGASEVSIGDLELAASGAIPLPNKDAERTQRSQLLYSLHQIETSLDIKIGM